MIRPSTPVEDLPDGRRRLTVKRSCDRCGRELGDATRTELDAAAAGRSLPSVAAECGCLFADSAVAALEGHRHVEMIPYPMPHWECECGQDLGAYLGDRFRALAPHQALIARDAVRSVIETLETS